MTTTMAGALILASPHPAPDLLWTPVAGRPLLAWSVAACEQTPAIAETLLLVPAERLADARALALAEGWARVRMLPGAAQVGESVEAGLRALDPALAWVVIVEASRPLVTSATLASLLAMAQHDNADYITGESVKETVKRQFEGLVVETLPRARMVRAQTPYVFHRERLLAAHASLPDAREYADEAMLTMAARMPLRIFRSARVDFPVKTAADVAVVSALLAEYHA